MAYHFYNLFVFFVDNKTTLLWEKLLTIKSPQKKTEAIFTIITIIFLRHYIEINL